jgi:ATP-dependent RNA helicase DHX29
VLQASVGMMRDQMDVYNRQAHGLRPGSVELDRLSHCLRPTLGGARTSALPAFAHYEKIIETCSMSQITILQGETGCGKSTQVPMYLATDTIKRQGNARIVCTQPSPFAAGLLAKRVRSEWSLGGNFPDAASQVVELDANNVLEDYKTLSFVHEDVFLDHVMNKSVLALKSVLTQHLFSEYSLGDLERALPFHYILIDEVHERNQATDLLLAILLKAYGQEGIDPAARVPLERLPKLVIMSATLNQEKFRMVRGSSAYF